MKKSIILAVMILVSTLLIQAPSFPQESLIHGCYQKEHGQLRIVGNLVQCLPSEVPISWNLTGSQGPQGEPGPKGSDGSPGPQGPPGIVYIGTLNGAVGDLTGFANATEYIFVGNTITVSTTTSQRILGAAETGFGTTEGIPSATIESITVYEQTAYVAELNYPIDDPLLGETSNFPTTFDFYGGGWNVGGTEVYDVYISNIDGVPNTDGMYITIDCFRPMCVVGDKAANNIDAVSLNYSDGSRVWANSVATYTLGCEQPLGLAFLERALGISDSSSTRVGDQFSSITLGFGLTQPMRQIPVLTVGKARFNYGLCYRQSGSTSSPQNFVTTNEPIGNAYYASGISSFSAMATIQPGGGTWEVGYCVKNLDAYFLNNNGNVNGWVLVTN